MKTHSSSSSSSSRWWSSSSGSEIVAVSGPKTLKAFKKLLSLSVIVQFTLEWMPNSLWMLSIVLAITSKVWDPIKRRTVKHALRLNMSGPSQCTVIPMKLLLRAVLASAVVETWRALSKARIKLVLDFEYSICRRSEKNVDLR